MEGSSWGRGGESCRESEEVIFPGLLTFSRSYLVLPCICSRDLESFGYHYYKAYVCLEMKPDLFRY